VVSYAEGANVCFERLHSATSGSSPMATRRAKRVDLLRGFRQACSSALRLVRNWLRPDRAGHAF